MIFGAKKSCANCKHRIFKDHLIPIQAIKGGQYVTLGYTTIEEPYCEITGRLVIYDDDKCWHWRKRKNENRNKENQR